MKKFGILFLSVLFFGSCGKNWKFSAGISVDEGEQMIVLDSDPEITIHYSTGLSEALSAAHFMEKAIEKMNQYGKAKSENYTVYLKDGSDFYELFFELGEVYFAGCENKALAFGVINMAWQEWVESSLQNEDFISYILRAEKYNLIRIDEFRDLFESYEIDLEEVILATRYVDNYLLNDILFVSIQELQEKDYRYYTTSDLDSFFMQGVVLLEMTDFARFLKKRYGVGKLSKLIDTVYDDEDWLNALGESKYDAETAFADFVQDTRFTGIFTDSDFLSELNSLLDLYNSTTKDTLFSRSGMNLDTAQTITE